MPLKKSKKGRAPHAKSSALTQEELAALDFIIKSTEPLGKDVVSLDAAAYAKAAAAVVRWATQQLFFYFQQNELVAWAVLNGRNGISEELLQVRMRKIEKLLAEIPAPSLEDLKRV